MASEPAKRENSPSKELEKAAAGLKDVEKGFSMDQILVAQLLATGMSRPEVAARLLGRLSRHMTGSRGLKLKRARNRIRNWQKNPKFLDLVYHYALIELDMALPTVFNGIVRKAAMGRVDAAKLLLEVTGRHAPNTDVVPAQIVLNFGGMARPVQLEQQAVEDTVEAEWDEV